MTLILAILIFILGATIGSFLSVIIYRLHTKKGGMILSRSVCPKCNATLKAIHLIPIFSWIFLRGKCAFCGAKISVRYLFLELLTGLLFLLAFINFDFLIVIPSSIDPSYFSYAIDWMIFEKFTFYIIILSFLITIFFYDLLYLEIPDKLSYPAIAVAVAGGLVIGMPPVVDMIIGGFAIFLFFAAQFYLSSGKWIGGGDLRLGILIGVILGLKMGLLALMIAYIIGALVSLILMIRKEITKKSIVPFAPFLVSGVIIVLFYGQEIIDWYFNLIMV